MLPFKAASIEKGAAELGNGNEGGSTRRNGELEARRLESRPTRLCLGEPRLWLIGVDVVVFGEESALRIEGTVGEAEIGKLGFWYDDGTRENVEGFVNPSVVVFDFLVGERKMEGLTFSESSSSSNTVAARRLPVEGWSCFSGVEELEAMAIETHIAV